MKNNKPNAAIVWKQLEDDLVPRLGLNLPERVAYAYLVRQSRLEGNREFCFGIIWLAGGLRLSQATTRYAVRSLAAKGAIRLIDRTQAGHLVEVFLPDEIRAAPHAGPLRYYLGQRSGGPNARSHDIEEMDFFERFNRREAIHTRERGQCFYCLRPFAIRGRVLDHVVPQARGGTNSYRNLVSCCVECNSQKGESGAEDFLRTLYRQRRITSAELESRLRALEALAAGELRPVLGPPAAASHVVGAGLVHAKRSRRAPSVVVSPAVGAGLAPPAAATRKPENPNLSKQTSKQMRKPGLPPLPKLARRKKARPVGAAFTGVPSSPKSTNPTERQSRKPAR